MNTTQQRLVNQLQLLHNFAQIRMKTLHFLMDPYKTDILGGTQKQLDQLGETLEHMLEHTMGKRFSGAEQALRTRSLGIFTKQLEEAIQLSSLSLNMLEDNMTEVELEPWERGIANQMVRHITTLFTNQMTLLEELLEQAAQDMLSEKDHS